MDINCPNSDRAIDNTIECVIIFISQNTNENLMVNYDDCDSDSFSQSS